MGLDGVELLMDVEEHFGISIKDTEATCTCTVGELVSLIRTRILAGSSAACPTLWAFLTLRRAIREATNEVTFRTLPSDQVALVLSPQYRLKLWRKLEELLGSQPPALRRSAKLKLVLAFCAFALLILSTAILCVDWRLLPFTLMISVALIVTLYSATTRLCTTPPIGWTDMGSIARRIAGTRTSLSRFTVADDDAILRELRPIVANCLGVDESQVVPAARLVEDLGA